MNITNEIHEYSKYLKLPGIRRNFERVIQEANETDMGYGEFLKKLLEEEYEIRNENSKLNRIRLANFPQKKYLEDLKNRVFA